MNTNIHPDHIHDLLMHYEKKGYSPENCQKGSLEYDTINRCESLLKLDYSIIEVNNMNGELCRHYPCKILIPQNEINHSGAGIGAPVTNVPGINQQQSGNTQRQQQTTIYEDSYDAEKLRESICLAKYARCRQRFVVPVILYRGKYICRSATVSLLAETCGRKVMNLGINVLNGLNPMSSTNEYDSITDNVESPSTSSTDFISSISSQTSETSIFEYKETYEDSLRKDVQLLKLLNVGTIIDLMVEHKKVKYFMYVSSSEKADPNQHYKDFSIISFPYPGCEFFKSYRDHNYDGVGLKFDWSQTFIDVTCKIPNNSIASQLKINWEEYRDWDLVILTQNYLKLILKYIQDDNSGLLIHCISGWDRTPLFTSLVRLSLWADGLIHQSLSPLQIVYFTLVYDWYLFGHQLPSRIVKGEDILFFCFHFLKHIFDDAFRVIPPRVRTKTISSLSDGEYGSCNSSINYPSSEEGKSNTSPLFAFEQHDENSSDSSIGGLQLPEKIITNVSPKKSPSKHSSTNPVSVPNSNLRGRQRHESTSSTDSWQMVTEAGSVESNTFNTLYRQSLQNESGSGDDNANKSDPPEPRQLTMREARLTEARALFLKIYSRSAGLKFKDEISSLSSLSRPITNIVGTITEQFK